jgi:hypothetical protein
VICAPVSASACHGRAYGLVERAADALYCAGIDAEPFGNSRDPELGNFFCGRAARGSTYRKAICGPHFPVRHSPSKIADPPHCSVATRC